MVHIKKKKESLNNRIWGREISSLPRQAGGPRGRWAGCGAGREERRSRRAWWQSLVFTLQTFPLGEQAPPSRPRESPVQSQQKKKNLPCQHLPPPLIHCRHCMDWRSCYRQSNPPVTAPKPTSSTPFPHINRVAVTVRNLTVIRQFWKDPDKFSCQKL